MQNWHYTTCNFFKSVNGKSRRNKKKGILLFINKCGIMCRVWTQKYDILPSMLLCVRIRTILNTIMQMIVTCYCDLFIFASFQIVIPYLHTIRHKKTIKILALLPFLYSCQWAVRECISNKYQRWQTYL